MPKTVLQVFLSSTSKDLALHRTKVRDVIAQLEQAAVCMETFGARPTTPLATCRTQVRQADALVVIVGHRYGWIPGETECGDGIKSITWWEVKWALDAKLPVYAYLVDPNAPLDGEAEETRLRNARTDEEALVIHRAVRGLQDFRDFLESKVTRKLFASVDDLTANASIDLSKWLLEERSKMLASQAGTDNPAGPDTVSTPSWAGSPFPGLHAFTPADEPIFFGRGPETDHLLKKLHDSACRFLLVVGTSGSGKSSLVAAGLLPRLASNAVPGSESWLAPRVERDGQGYTWLGLRFTPGEQGADPFQALANRLAPLLPDGQAARDVATELFESPDHFPALVDEALSGRPSQAQAVVFIDQFEELVTVTTDAERQHRFVELLSAAAQSSRVRIIGTVRADFYHRCIENEPRLAEVLRDHGATVPLAVPGAKALVEMVDGPARAAGLRLDDGLVDRLVDGTVARPGGLALLAFALHELYAQRTDDSRLTTKAYDAFGGLSGVISTRAEATFGPLDVPEQTLGAVFSALVTVDEHGVATRRRAMRHDAEHAGTGAATLISTFERARLLVPDRAEDGTVVVQVAHEALFREWPRLRAWIDERADDLRLLRQVESAAADWDHHGRAAPYAWPHERLEPVHAALERLGRTRNGLPEPTRAFLEPETERLLRELDEPRTTHQRRAAIGDRLDQIGDPRPGVGLTEDGTPDIVWCAIPAGRVTLEGVDGEFEVEAFHIAKYPVTYCQYTVFLDAPDGYRSSKHWKGLEHEPEPGQQYRPTGNCPTENVSWYDATAFCRWLSGRLGFEVRLPTEWEWQQAATGGTAGNMYPWGPDWEDGAHANTSEGRLSRTTAVGMYPRGASHQEVLDLSGNVWEWCANLQRHLFGQPWFGLRPQERKPGDQDSETQ